MITLYTYSTPNGHRVSIALEELGMPYEVRVIDLSKGEHLGPDYARINPLGKIPAIVDDGQCIFGSTAILYHLADKQGQLMPTTPAARTQAHVWLAFAGGDLGPALVSRYYFGTRAEEKLPGAIAYFDHEAGRCFRTLESRLAEVRFLAGDEYSMADIAVYPFVAALAQLQPAFLADLPHLRRWHDEVSARPAVARGMAAAPRTT